MKHQIVLACAGAALVGGLMLNSGCGARERLITAERLRSELSPSYQGMANTRDERLDNKARGLNLMRRQMTDEIDAALFNDRPLRLSKYPVP